MMFDSIFETITNDTITLPNLLIAFGAAIVLGLMISFVYLKTSKKGVTSQSFTITLAILPAVVTVIILLVGSNVARAFSLAGAFSIIRFRSAPGNAKDITYVLFSMAVGLAAGMGFVLYAVVVAVGLCGVTAVLEAFNYGNLATAEKILKITIPENLDYKNAFDGVMKKYTAANTLNRIKTTDLGSLYELAYTVTIKNVDSEKEFIDELRCRNGNLNITLVLNDTGNGLTDNVL